MIKSISAASNNVTDKPELANEYRGDTVSPDLRTLLADNPNGSDRLDVILQAKDANDPALRSIMAQFNVHLQDRIGSTDTVVVNLPLSAIEALAQSGAVNYMSPDRPIGQLGHLEDATGASVIRSQTNASGSYTLDGTGIGIAILDSGMIESHKSFKASNGSSRIVYSQSFVPSEPGADDNYGHGTHVAGIAAGSSSRNNGAYRGVAPNANIINLKVLDGAGRGQSSWLLNALDWLVNNHQTYNIRVINMSLGGTAVDTYTNDVVCRKVQELNALGILVVAAAGNEGKSPDGDKMYGHIHSPGNEPSALTVGAINTKDTNSRSDDTMASFSSRGPTRSFYTNAFGQKVYDHVIKPDLVAPGNKIASAKAKSTSYLVTHYPNLSDPTLNSTTADESMLYMSGTSMSTPVVAGAAALLFQQNPNLTPQMVKMIFEYTAQPLNGYNMFEQGAGQLNLEGAIRFAKTYRTDIDFNSSATSGMSLLATGQSFPTPQTTLNGQTFAWSQGILTNNTSLKGQRLAEKFHNVYKNNAWFEQGITKNVLGAILRSILNLTEQLI